MKTLEYFKTYIKEKIDSHYWETPSSIVLKSFYMFEVEKPIEITIRQFDWLRSIAEKEIKNYKSISK